MINDARNRVTERSQKDAENGRHDDESSGKWNVSFTDQNKQSFTNWIWRVVLIEQLYGLQEKRNESYLDIRLNKDRLFPSLSRPSNFRMIHFQDRSFLRASFPVREFSEFDIKEYLGIIFSSLRPPIFKNKSNIYANFERNHMLVNQTKAK